MGGMGGADPSRSAGRAGQESLRLQFAPTGPSVLHMLSESCVCHQGPALAPVGLKAGRSWWGRGVTHSFSFCCLSTCCEPGPVQSPGEAVGAPSLLARGGGRGGGLCLSRGVGVEDMEVTAGWLDVAPVTQGRARPRLGVCVLAPCMFAK